MVYNKISNFLCVLIICMLISSCTLMKKTGNTILPQTCINFGSSFFHICLFPFNGLKENSNIKKEDYIPLGFQLKTPGFYKIHASVKEWVEIGPNMWRSKEFVIFKCSIHDLNSQTMLDNVTKFFYSFNIENQRYNLEVSPFPENKNKGTYLLYIYIQSSTKPGILTIDLSANNENLQNFIRFSRYFFKLNNSEGIHNLSVKRISNQGIGLFLEKTYNLPEKYIPKIPDVKTYDLPEKYIPKIPDVKRIKQPERRIYPDKNIYQEEITDNDKDSKKNSRLNNINPSGILLCSKGVNNINASVRVNDWKKKGNYWQGLMYTFNFNGKKYTGLMHQNDDDFGPDRYEIKFCKGHRKGVPLLINIISKKRPGTLTFNYRINNQKRSHSFLNFTELQRYFTMNGKVPSSIIPDRESYTFKRSKKITMCPALTLSFYKKNQYQADNQQRKIYPSKDEKYIEPIRIIKPESVPYSNDKVAILPFSIMHTDELAERLNQHTIRYFHKLVKKQLKQQTNLNCNELSYPNNIEPYSEEAIEMPMPTIDPIIEDDPEYVLKNLCKKSNSKTILFGHFEEDLLNNKLRIIIRVFDCQSSKYKTFVETISVPKVSEKTIKTAVKKLIKAIDPHI
ncbi:secreted protein [Candidatus Magnetomorum sp. HK-1]|nr:secreted protein [Candidatus Magnetomorum sp. HK-1]